MKPIFLLALVVASFNSFAGNNKNPQWQPTTLSDTTIKKIQQAKYQYMLCITKEMQNKTYIKLDTRAATDKVLIKCEPSLAQVRAVFTEEKVPTTISDRYLKKTRTQTARKVLEQFMYAQAARKMGK